MTLPSAKSVLSDICLFDARLLLAIPPPAAAPLRRRYAPVVFDSFRVNAREAALKYFVRGSVDSAFILFGCALIYGATGTMELPKIAALSGKDALVYGDLYNKVGFGLAIVGTKAAAFTVTARFLVNVVSVENQGAFLLPLAAFAAASMILGATVGIWQTDLKRLMATRASPMGAT